MLMSIIIPLLFVSGIVEVDSHINKSDIDTSSLKQDRSADSCYRVASLELNRKYGLDCRTTAELNLKTIETACEIASKHGAKILLLPEDGIIYEPRTQLETCLEEIPDPTKLTDGTNNPCQHVTIYNDSMPILSKLSCLANQHKIYLIGNYVTKQSCRSGSRIDEEICPDRGYFMLNTNVVMDPQGTFVQRYRKYNTFFLTEIFDKAPGLELSYFDTPYGRFGVFTCFDILFPQPSLALLDQFKVDTVLFPTWWFDELPILSALQFQDAWSMAHGVNLISANIIRPEIGSSGSAIFSDKKTLFSGARGSKTRVLMADIAKHGTEGSCEFKPQIVDVGKDESVANYKHFSIEILPTDSTTSLEAGHGLQTRCAGEVCCLIDYEATRIDSNSSDRLLLIVRDSPRAGFYGWYEQFCVLATIRGDQEKQTDDSSIKRQDVNFLVDAAFKFERLKITVNSTTKYMYPLGAHNVDKLIARDKRHFECVQHNKNDILCDIASQDLCNVSCEHSLIMDKQDKELDVYSFGLYGRKYSKDVKPKRGVKPIEHHHRRSEF